jgi:hypothetical protein
MRIILVVVAIVVLLAAVAVASAVSQQGRTGKDPARGGDNPYEGLRSRALTTPPSTIGITTGNDEVWGVVMDLPVSNGTATVVAFSDGTASIYLTSGGGFIGGGRHAAVQQAAQAFVAAARTAKASFKPATAFPLPAPGQVRFYARVGDGVRMAEATQQALESAEHPLAAVYAAGHAVITAYRELEK